MALLNRSWRLSLEINGVAKTYQELENNSTSLKIDFEVDSSINGAFSNGIITIYGLSNDDVAFLSTNYNPQNGQLYSSKVSLEVGYSGNVSLILYGNISEAEPDFTTPDTRLRIKVMSNLEHNLQDNKVKDSISKTATFKKICELTAKNNNLSLEYDSSIPDKNIGDYSFFGTPFQQIENLRQYQPNNVSIFVQNKKLIVSLIKANSAKKMLLDNQSGMIGSPKPTPFGVEVTSLLNPSLIASDFIELNSIKLPRLNGLYKIISISHKGGNRSETWLSQMMLRKAF